jgi:resuscitation-promoting factor RpfB
MASNSSQLNGIALACVGTGALFLWSAITDKKITSVIQNILMGKSPKTASTQTETGNLTEGSLQGLISGNTSADSETASHNQAIAKVLAAPLGWAIGQQWTCLVELWNQESGWSNTAENPSGAYGIAQALPNTKYPLPGRPPSEGGSANPTTQIAWGLSYILTTYGSPCNAWAHETSYGWY